MGGCSSKPKTAEFEGLMDLQEDKPQDEAPGNNSEAENAGLRGIDRQQEFLELTQQRERHDMRDMFAATAKLMIAGLSPDGNFEEERQVLEDDPHHVKQVLEETINDSGAEKDLSVKEEILKLQINPEVLASESLELHEDPVFIIEISKEHQETALPSAIEAESVDTQHKPLTLTKETSENEAKDVFSESNTVSLPDICISPNQDTSKLEMKPICPQDGHIELSKDLSAGGEEFLELQKEPFEGFDPGLQTDAPKEASKVRVESEHDHELVYRNGEQRLDDSFGHEGQDKHFGEETKECEELCKETEAGAREVVNAASDGVLALERGEDVLKPISDQEYPREIGSTDAVYPAITADVSPNNLQHVVHEQAFVHEEQEVDVDAAASRSAESLTKLLAEPDSAPIEYKVAMKDVEVLKKKSYGAVEGLRKSDASSTPDEVTASQVVATSKKPEAQSVQVMEFAELASIPAQDIPAPDIDEVLEKLASEFERQERVAHATP